MYKVFFQSRITNHDIGHSKFIFENINVSNGKKDYKPKVILVIFIKALAELGVIPCSSFNKNSCKLAFFY